MATGGRQIHQQVVHFLRRTIGFADGQTSTYTIGVVPAGALILKPMSGVAVTTAFNDATNKLIHIGTVADDDLLGTSLSVAATTFVPLDEAVGGYLVTADTTIVYKGARSGTAATAGAGEIVIAYIPDTDG